MAKRVEDPLKTAFKKGLEDLVNDKGVTVAAVFRKTGIAKTRLYNVLRGQSSLEKEDADLIKLHFPQYEVGEADLTTATIPPDGELEKNVSLYIGRIEELTLRLKEASEREKIAQNDAKEARADAKAAQNRLNALYEKLLADIEKK
jgi:hypothetical protein